MTQTSFFWDGSTLGDATAAPYDYADFATFFENVAGNFIVPGYLFDTEVPGDELNVIGDAANFGQVIVKPGVALVHGVVYVLDAETTIAVPATAGANPAIHRIVLDKDTVTQTVRVGIREGTEAALPEPAAVASNEMTIAWIWVSGAYNPAADLVSDADIHDERVFRHIGTESARHDFVNLISNGQFMGHSRGANHAPDGWVDVNTPVLTYATGGRVSRGWSLRLQGGANEGVETTFPINRGTTASGELYTIRGYIEVDVDSIDVEVYAQALDGAAVLFATKTFNAMISPLSTNRGLTEFIIRIRINPASTTQNALLLRITSNTATTDAYVGDIGVFPDYRAGTKETVRKTELIMLDQALTDASWTATAKSTGSTIIDLSTSFGGMFRSGYRGVIVRVRCRDSGSAAAAVANGTAVRVFSYNSTVSTGSEVGIVSCTGLPNDSWASGVVYVMVEPGDSTPNIFIACNASGALTLDVTLEIIGIII